MIDYNNVLQTFPPILQETINGEAFAKIIQYFFYGDETLKSSLVLSNANPFYESVEFCYIYEKIVEKSINEATCDALAVNFNLKGYEFAGLFNAILGVSVLDIKRDLISAALELKRHEGTPYAIELILTKFGYSDIELTENISISLIRNGTFLRNGTIARSGNLNNQLFSVTLTSNHDVSQVDLEEQNAIISMINLYKKYRPELYQLIIKEPSNLSGRVIQVWI